MKSALFAIALLTGGAAIAQTDYDKTTTDTTMETTETVAVPAGGQIVLPSNADPEHDARGIAVISDPAVAPAGFNHAPGVTDGMGGPLVDTSTALAPQPATESYPPCTETVTDNCVQTYERGRSPQ